MNIQLHRKRAALVGLLVATAAWVGCASTPEGDDAYRKTPALLEGEAFLAGETLAQRKQKMERAHRDLRFFHDNLESLQRHRQAAGITQLEEFLRRYMVSHVDEMLSDREAGWAPELATLDAQLLFAKADLLLDMQEAGRLADLVTEIEERFDGMESLVVEYPLGVENTLADAFDQLEQQQRSL